MSERQPTRAELLARLAASSKDAVVLAEMQRLGFWPTDAAQPTPEAALIQREAELLASLDQLHRDLCVQGDPQAALRAMRKERMAQARERREATAQAREQQRYERALRWHATRHLQVGYLGAGVSAGLQADRGTRADPARLARHQLPALDTPLALAEAMGLSVAELKFLCFHREVARTSHYRRFALPKKTGGERIISAPMPRLKRAQYWVLDQVLAKVACHPAAHGFMPGRSIVSNAAPHCAQAVVINLDLKNFFPSIHYPRIKGVFAALGYSEPVATLLALLCSENPCDELVLDGERYYVGGAARERVLPQGAPTSPMLTNVLCRKLDRRLHGAATKLGYTYTRYADDLTFSAGPEAAAATGRLLRQVHFIIADEGLTLHPDKQRVMRASGHQEVTGVVVNHQTAAPRAQRRALRAALHRASTQGLAAATWQGHSASAATLLGYAQFVHMVNARQGAALLSQARALAGKAVMPAPGGGAFRQASARGVAPTRASGEAWWVPVLPAPPALQLTAGQHAEARRARRLAARVERSPRVQRGGAGAAPLPDAAADANAIASRPPLPLGRLSTQFLLIVYLASKTKSVLVFTLGLLWLCFSLYKGRFSWWRFIAVMGAILLIGQVMRG